MVSPDNHRPKSALPWVVAVTIISVVAILSVLSFLGLRSLAEIPKSTLEQAEETLDAMQDLVKAFRQGEVENRFLTYATRISGSTYLQIATIDQVEVFTREDRASIFWGAIQLPDVVVSATAPVQYTAYVDLDEPWALDLTDTTVHVDAPPIRFNQPAIDVSRIEFEIREGSLLRDEEEALEALKRGLTSHAHRRTQELEPKVRETAREQIAQFVRAWILQSFALPDDFEVAVQFADEVPTDRLRLDAVPQD